ncbi:MAG TPA: hypothetical protein DCZ91_08985 [Lachnospiraceae bacterium]|nr:hypothetical protein [Lachnospiraceae bacterium]
MRNTEQLTLFSAPVFQLFLSVLPFKPDIHMSDRFQGTDLKNHHDFLLAYTFATSSGWFSISAFSRPIQPLFSKKLFLSVVIWQ